MKVTAEQRELFLTLVADSFDDQIEIDAEKMVVRDGNGFFGLANLFQEVWRLPEKEWRSYINQHFHLLRQVPTDLPAFSAVAEHLRIRLLAPDVAPEVAPCLMVRPLTEGLDQTLVIRTDYGSRTVPPTAPDQWQVDPDELWRRATERTIWDEPLERRRCLGPRGEQLVWVRGGFYTSSLILDLGHLITPRNQHGAVVMVPCRDALLYAELEDAGVVDAAVGMLELGGIWYNEGPGSLSPDLFWWRPQGVSRIVAMGEGRFTPVWGEDFSEVLQSLSVA